MPYDSTAARAEMLEEIGRSIDELGIALAGLGEAYEQLDENSADRLEETLFGPIQTALGRAKRTHAAFAERAGVEVAAFAPAPEPAVATAPALVQDAVHWVGVADDRLAELQDSLAPVEIGDRELREGLAGVRQLLDVVDGRAREFERTLGR